MANRRFLTRIPIWARALGAVSLILAGVLVSTMLLGAAWGGGGGHSSGGDGSGGGHGSGDMTMTTDTGGGHGSGGDHGSGDGGTRMDHDRG